MRVRASLGLLSLLWTPRLRKACGSGISAGWPQLPGLAGLPEIGVAAGAGCVSTAAVAAILASQRASLGPFPELRAKKAPFARWHAVWNGHPRITAHSQPGHLSVAGILAECGEPRSLCLLLNIVVLFKRHDRVNRNLANPPPNITSAVKATTLGDP